MRRLLLPLFLGLLVLGVSSSVNEAAAQRYRYGGRFQRHVQRDFGRYHGFYDRRYDCGPRVIRRRYVPVRRYHDDWNCGPRFYRRYDCGPRFGVSVCF